MFLEKHRERTGTDSSGALYNRYMTLLNRDLLSGGVDMHLPHCWYRWGDEVAVSCLPFIDWDRDDPSCTSVRYTDRSPRIDSKDPNVRFASDYADAFIGKYAETCGQEAIGEVYSDAPFAFQNDFRKLREAVGISRENVPVEDCHSGIKELFETAVASFPPNFGSLSQRFEEFTSTFRLAMSNDAEPDELYEISETFWLFFCYHLRLNGRCHENVPQSTLEAWKEILPNEEEKYHMFVQNQAARYCRKAGSDWVIDRLMQERDRRLKESDDLFAKVFGREHGHRCRTRLDSLLIDVQIQYRCNRTFSQSSLQDLIPAEACP